jgi:tRNA threonylcarbamoyladenosine biosynthesis protein TsaE
MFFVISKRVRMNFLKIQLRNLTDTEKLGRLLGKMAKPGEIICLDGDLGAGKTTLTQAIARGLEVPADCYVTSPSFAILHEYEGRIPLYHMDFYRLQNVEEIIDLGFEEYFYLSGLTVIEWSVKAREILPDERLSLELFRDEEDGRIVAIHETGILQKKIQHIKLQFQSSARQLPE